MKITFLLISIERSGGVRVTIEIANQLAKLKHKCSLVVLGNEPIPFPVHQDVEIIRTQSSSRTILSAITKVFTLASGVPADSDIVVASYYLTAYSAILAKLIAKSSCLFYIIQGYEPNYFRQKSRRIKWISYLLARLSYYLPLHKTAISHWLSSVLAIKGHQNIPVLNNGISSEVFTHRNITVPSAKFVIMTFANSRPNRGFYDFCAAVELLAQKRLDFELLLVGTEPAVANVLTLPYHFLTPLNDEELVAAYHKASIFVTCSHEEGFGLTPLEAMSCGVPVVCTDSGGLRDYASGDENCLMVPVRDINQIAAAIMQLFDNSELRTKFIINGQKTALQFDWPIIGAQYEALFMHATKSVRS